MRNSAHQLLERGPAIPTPSAAGAAALSLDPDGTQLTVKQRDSAWLPGGALKLHLDDIADRQVLVSITDEQRRGVFGPQSVRGNDKVRVENIEIAVVRVKDIAIGSSDFGEFEVVFEN